MLHSVSKLSLWWEYRRVSNNLYKINSTWLEYVNYQKQIQVELIMATYTSFFLRLYYLFIHSCFLDQIQEMGSVTNRGLYKVIERKTCASRKTDRQLCTGIYRPSGTCSCQQLLASSLSFYLHMSICTLTLCEPQVTEVPHVAQFPLVHDVSRANTHQSTRSKL